MLAPHSTSRIAAPAPSVRKRNAPATVAGRSSVRRISSAYPSGSSVSAWRNSRCRPRAAAAPAFCCAARPPAVTRTVAPACAAISRVASRLPPSATMISMPSALRTRSRVRPSEAASLSVGMITESSGLPVQTSAKRGSARSATVSSGRSTSPSVGSSATDRPCRLRSRRGSGRRRAPFPSRCPRRVQGDRASSRSGSTRRRPPGRERHRARASRRGPGAGWLSRVRGHPSRRPTTRRAPPRKADAKACRSRTPRSPAGCAAYARSPPSQERKSRRAAPVKQTVTRASSLAPAARATPAACSVRRRCNRAAPSGPSAGINRVLACPGTG